MKSIIALQKYLHALEEAFLFFYVQRFSFKAKERITTPKKVYGIDTGMIQAKTVSFSSNTGKLYENIVAIELKKLEIQGKCQFFYWKSKKDEEVDFVIKEGQNVTQLIQVCMDVGSEKTKMREVRALLKAGSELNCKDLLILTKDQEGTENAEWFGLHGGIVYLPLWKWLLDENKKK
ncbi:ATP-binding protein [Candidatus Woesearchaeota archaeon]|nr:ATP-binding protein [Candidatus Woesearchaeota archaeon]